MTTETTTTEKVDTTATTEKVGHDFGREPTTTTDTKTATAADGRAAMLLASGADAVDTTKTNIPVEFPEDWREKLAGENKDDLKTLSRYTQPKALWDALKSMRTKLSAGELKAVSAFPAEGDDAAKLAWRKENGIPEKAEAYEPKIEGLVFGDADKPMLESFKAHAHGKNWTPGQFNEALGWYAAEQQQIKARQDAADETFRSESKDSLYTEWGPQDFKANINAVKNLMSSAPSGFEERLLGARLSDGRLLGDDPGALKWLASLAREINPAATLVPPGTSDPAKSVQARLEEISNISRDDPDRYNADKKLQAERLQLTEVMQKFQKRNAA